MSETARYIDIPSYDLLDKLRTIGVSVQKKGGEYNESFAGNETVFDIYLPNRQDLIIRIYTSLSMGSKTVRGCGKDAIRIVIGAIHKKTAKFIPLSQSTRVYRTAPQNKTHQERVEAFLDRLTKTLRHSYISALEMPQCPQCNSPMKKRINKKSNQPFFGCTDFPNCNGTRKISALTNDSDC